jgi:hypothetical protein
VPQWIVAVLALLFTVGSFWWMNWRRGMLLVGPPRSYGAAQEGDVLLMHVPLVFFNPAPTPIIVHHLRLVFADRPAQTPLYFIATVEGLGMTKERRFATQFLVRGRDGVSLVCDFQRRPSGPSVGAGHYRMELEAMLLGSDNWRRICSFRLNVPYAIPTHFQTFDNLAEDHSSSN